jgi:hypothetical protein
MADPIVTRTRSCDTRLDDDDDIKDVFENCELCVPNTRSCDGPFFQPSVDDSNVARPHADHSDLITIFSKNNNIPSDMTRLYLLMGETDREMVYRKKFTLFSVKEMQANVALYESAGQSGICDVGLTYYGMGHVILLTLSRVDGTFFFRIDGGANGWEQEARWRTIINLDPVTIEKRMTFLEALDQIEHDNMLAG